MSVYRHDIDGLRAVAVWPVILFHAGAPYFTGGYVGVDVFFVVSGYLITSLIVREVESGTFRLCRFWERRARRILPALLFVMVCCIPFAWAWMLPDDLENFGQSLVATTLFSNNMLLAVTTGYWDTLTQFKPLYHTWSLGVEEQFYLVYPLLTLVLVRRWGRRGLLVGLSILGVGSFVLSYLALDGQMGELMRRSAYLLLPTRAWELLLGGLLVVLPRTTSANRGLDNIWASFGLLMILAAVLMFSEDTPVPGPAALLPTFGAALVLRFSSTAGVGRLLGSKPIARMGVLSYSAYLWHQPILAFMRIYSPEPPSELMVAAAIVGTWAMAEVTWRFVEEPFRRKISFKLALAPTAIFCAVTVCFGLAANYTRGFPTRLWDGMEMPTQDQNIAYNNRAYTYIANHFDHTELTNVLVLGDSFAADFVNVITETLPMDKAELVYNGQIFSCFEWTTSPEWITLWRDADVIVLANDIYEQPSCFAGDIQIASNAGKQLFYVGIKEFGSNLNWIARLPHNQRALKTNKLSRGTVEYEAFLRSQIPDVHYISILDGIATGQDVTVTDSSGRLLSFDGRHLTRPGARWVGSHVLPGTQLAASITGRSDDL